MPLRINVVTIFPEFFSGPLGLSIPSRAAAAGSVRYNLVDLRDFTHDKHRTVDDAPYGGGAGMVMKPQPFFEAVESLNTKPPIVLLSPRGRVFSHADAERFAAGEELGTVTTFYELPQGLMLDINTRRGSVLIPYRPEIIVRTDIEARTILINDTLGLMDTFGGEG